MGMGTPSSQRMIERMVCLVVDYEWATRSRERPPQVAA